MDWKHLLEPSKRTTKWWLKKKENGKKDIFHFKERKRKRVGNMSSLLLKYLLMHRSHNSHIVLNLVIKEIVAPLQLMTRINPYNMI